MPLIPVRDEDTLKRAIESAKAVIYKHSSRCWVSAMAEREVRAFSIEHPDLPVYFIDVIGGRGLSQRAASVLRVPHASPQAIMVIEGEPVWWASHGSVRAKALSKTVAHLRDATA